jgi:hypothetical protein
MKKSLFLLIVISSTCFCTSSAQRNPVNNTKTSPCSQDTDGDGVPDCRDKELITPTYCQPVDANGVGKCPCPDPSCFVVPAVAAKSAIDNEVISLRTEINTQKILIEAQKTELENMNQQLQDLKRIVSDFKISASQTLVKETFFKAFSFPNPSGRFFTINTQSGNNQPIHIKVFDGSGGLIEERMGIAANKSFQIGEGYVTGTYLVELIQGNERATLKLLKQTQ